MRKTTLKTIVVSVLFAACASGVFGVDAYVSELYRQIDIAFSDKSENTLNNILSKIALMPIIIFWKTTP